jgi:hypothetical protein
VTNERSRRCAFWVIMVVCNRCASSLRMNVARTSFHVLSIGTLHDHGRDIGTEVWTVEHSCSVMGVLGGDGNLTFGVDDFVRSSHIRGPVLLAGTLACAHPGPVVPFQRRAARKPSCVVVAGQGRLIPMETSPRAVVHVIVLAFVWFTWTESKQSWVTSLRSQDTCRNRVSH